MTFTAEDSTRQSRRATKGPTARCKKRSRGSSDGYDSEALFSADHRFTKAQYGIVQQRRAVMEHNNEWFSRWIWGEKLAQEGK